MAGYGSFTILDYGGEKTSVQFQTGNITAISLPGFLTDFGNLRTAIEGITLGVVAQEEASVFRTKLSNTLPASKDAQRERKWLVVYEDNTPFFDDPINAIPNEGYKKIFTNEIGTADLSLLVSRSDTIEAGDAGEPAAIATFRGAWNALVKSPHGGTARVLKLVAVGRRL